MYYKRSQTAGCNYYSKFHFAEATYLLMKFSHSLKIPIEQLCGESVQIPLVFPGNLHLKNNIFCQHQHKNLFKVFFILMSELM